MITIYGHPATSAGRCYWLLEELGIEYKSEKVDMRAKEHKAPAFLEMNPNGKIPVLKDGSFTLFESLAINQYLAERFNPSLLGDTLEERAIVHQWNVWSQVEYQKPMIDLFIQLVFVPEGKRDEAIIEKAREKIAGLNQILDRSLLGKTYIAKNSFTTADLNLASVAKINKFVGISLDQLPNLAKWLEKTLARPAAQKVTAMERS